MPMSANVSNPQFLTTLHAVAQKAREVLPEANGRIDRAVELVLNQHVTLTDHGAVVQSRTHAERKYAVNGSCPCADAPRAPHGWCQHRIAAALFKRTQEALTNAKPALVDELPPVEDPAPAGIDRWHIVHIQGKPFVKFAGLLQLAHERGLVSLTAEWTYNSDELSLAHAVATFQDGRRFEESGDASPSNVTKKVAPHFRRVALTRSKARVLRDALGLDLCSIEELAEGDEA